ncbi:MAG: TIM barrel protein [Bacteroidota bacterium]
MTHPRRKFIKRAAGAGAGLVLLPGFISSCTSPEEKSTDTASAEGGAVSSAEGLFFQISLAQWSLHKAIQSGEIAPLAFPQIAREEFDIGGVEYVNQLFMDKATDTEWLTELNQRASDHGVENLLIMCDREGNLGDTDDARRKQAVENHYKWIDAARFLGCHSIRVNAAGDGTRDEVANAAVDGLGRLSEYGAQVGINVIVENHGGYSSDAEWLGGVIGQVGMENCGTLPDFGNFCIQKDKEGNCVEAFDIYQGTTELMKYAKGVSAKSHNFTADGNERDKDYLRLMRIVKDAGYRGFVGVEYEGNELSEFEGIIATKNLLIKVGEQLS